jgi:hypothetical protein
VARQSAVEAGARERKITGVISRNDTLYFATVSGWTHAERWQPNAEHEVERLRREGHGEAVQTENGAGNGHTLGDGEGGVEQGTGPRAEEEYWG